MVTVAEALKLVLAQACDFGTEEIDLQVATGRVLAQDVVADRNYPPFNRVTMDGVAINSAAWLAGKRAFKIEGIQAAGQPQQTIADQNNCLEVMTGAMLPANTNVVIPYELCEITDGMATVKAKDITLFQNVHLESTDSKTGDVLLQKNKKITAAMVGLLASAGLSKIFAKALPKVAVCATGDELVELERQPLPHQIRQSNSYMLTVALGCEAIKAQRYHLPDEPVKMLEQLTTITGYYDVVLLSGAVSKGKFDYLPKVLDQLGIEIFFHGISQRPGKPFLFGKMPNHTLIFGFPGNPVSTFVCYQLYFRHWLAKSLGIAIPPASAFLSRPFFFKPDLTLHLLVKLCVEKGRVIAKPAETTTSGDLVILAQTEGILSLPKERQDFGVDEAFPLLIM